MADQANKKRTQDWLGLSILVSTAIFVALFVLAQIGQFVQDSRQQEQASGVQAGTHLQNLR